jgi:hypothetical protein
MQDVINSVTLSFLLFVGYSSFFTLCNTSFLTRSVQLIFSIFFCTTFQNFARIFDLLSEVSKSQHDTKLYSKCSTLLVSFLHLSPVFGEKSLLVECYMLHGFPGFNFTCMSCIICYRCSNIIEIFHILLLLLIYQSL